MFGARPGTWWINSTSDPRWDQSGHVELMLISAGAHPDAQAIIDQMKGQYGDPPKDLEYGCIKD